MHNKEYKPSPDKAIDILVQTKMLLIGLATSLLAFKVTFLRDINTNLITWHIKISWAFLTISVVAGVFVLQKITGELAINKKVSIYDCWIKSASVIQNLCFLVGVIWVAFFIY